MTWQTGSTQSMKRYNRQQNKGAHQAPFLFARIMLIAFAYEKPTQNKTE